MSLSAETVAEFKAWLTENPDVASNLAKAGGITSATGIVAYDLQAPSEKAFPLITPLRAMIPRVKGNGDTAHRWKMILSLDKSIHASVGEGQRGGVISTTVTPMMAAYAGLGLENAVTFEARYGAEGFEDVKALAVSQGVYALQQQEEYQLLGGMQTGRLGKMNTPTVTSSLTTGSLTALAYHVKCVALTLFAYKNFSVSSGLSATVTRDNAGETSSTKLNGGTSQVSDAGTVTLTSGTAIDCIADAVAGAAAYAWYVQEASGGYTLTAITSIAKVTITALNAAGQVLDSQFAADHSFNDESTVDTKALEYDGFFSLINRHAALGCYFKDMKGVALASDTEGGIDVISNAMTDFWDKHRLCPTDVWVSGVQAKQIIKAVISNNSQPIVRINTGTTGEKITGGFQIPDLLCPYTNTSLTVHIHPDMPAGTMLFTSSRLPYQIQDLKYGTMVVRERQSFYGLEWPMTSRKHEMGVYVDANLEVHTPFAFGAITGLG